MSNQLEPSLSRLFTALSGEPCRLRTLKSLMPALASNGLKYFKVCIFISEVDLGTKCVVDMDADQTVLYHPSTGMKAER